MKIFISYSRNDEHIAKEFENKFFQKGITTWRDNTDIYGGKIWREEIVKAISDSDFFLVLLSNSSISSDNVRKELDLAESYGKYIIPILLDDFTIPQNLQYQLSGVQYLIYSNDIDEQIEKILSVIEASTPNNEDIKTTQSKRDKSRIRISKRALRNAIVNYFSIQEVAVLCADVEEALNNDGINLRVNLDIVGGQGQIDQTLKLIGFLERRGYLDYLTKIVLEKRPGIFEKIRSVE